jgi:hypothetical protein
MLCRLEACVETVRGPDGGSLDRPSAINGLPAWGEPAHARSASGAWEVAASQQKKPATEDVAWREGYSPPDGFILWHNHVKHGGRTRQGTNGFRACFSLPSAKHVVCDCGRRPELGKHYRIDR